MLQSTTQTYLDINVKLPTVFPILTKFGFSKQVLIKVSDINITKFLPVVAELIYAEGQADMMKLKGLIRKRLKSSMRVFLPNFHMVHLLKSILQGTAFPLR
jgi:hypothetical protein